MFLDIKTLIICNAAFSLFVALCLMFYRKYYKTYEGYGLWLSSIFVLSFAYLFILFREFIPVWISILVANTGFVLVGVMRFDGIKRFSEGVKINRLYYAIPVLTIPFSLYYHFVENNLVFRNMITSIFLGVMSLSVSFVFYANRKSDNKKIYTATSILLFSYGFLINLRAFSWLFYSKDSLLTAGAIHQIYFLVVTVIEVGIGFTWIMINNQKLETELVESGERLRNTVNELEKALKDVKKLSGIIPICMHCKEIRDDKGYWNQIETFIRQHSEAEFSHGICPDCLKKRYPDLYRKKYEEK